MTTDSSRLADLEQQNLALQQQLRQSEQKFSAIFENSSFAAAISDRETGALIAVNAAWVAAFGYSAEEAVGKTPQELNITPAADVQQRMQAEMAQNNSVHDLRLSLQVKSGEWHSFILDIDLVPVGERECLLTTIQDITGRLRAEEALQKSEKQYRELVQSAPTGIYSVDLLANRFTSVNDAMCQLTGYSREELLAIRPLDLVDEASQQLFLRRLAQSLAGESPDQNVEYKVITKDGRTIDVVLNTTFILDEKGRPAGATVVCHDITERKRIEQALRESEKQYREIVQFAPTGIYEVDFRGGRFVSVNDAMCQVTGYSREELLAMSPFDLLDANSRKSFQYRVAQWIAGEKPDQTVEYRVLAKDGRELDAVLNTTFTRDENGSPLGATVIAHDITERKRMEQALQEYATRLEQSNQDLERFAVLASHDLQEPLRKVINFGERVKARLGEQIDEETRDYLDRIQAASQRMQKMIDGLLVMSRIVTQGQPLVPVDLNQVVTAILADLDLLIQKYEGDVTVARLPEVTADPVQMHQLFHNLIVNALKFHRPGVPPQVRVFAEPARPGETHHRAAVRICVLDNGIGFDERNVQRIFQPFQRLVARTDFEGSGMGLAICKKIVDHHGGSISARSEPGVGSTFIVCLPV